MLMRYDPFRELDHLAQQLGRPAARPALPMDAYRHGDRVVVELDLPGVDPGSIELTVEKNVLSVTADRRRSFGEGDDVLVAERPQGQFSRQILLGEQLDTEDISADYADGVLTLTLPVAEQAKPRKVQVGTGSSTRSQLAGSAA